jgi:hypothetical protein
MVQNKIEKHLSHKHTQYECSGECSIRPVTLVRVALLCTNITISEQIRRDRFVDSDTA